MLELHRRFVGNVLSHKFHPYHFCVNLDLPLLKLMMEAVCYSELSLSTCSSTQCQNPESKNLATPCCDNLANYTDLTLVTVLLTTIIVI